MTLDCLPSEARIAALQSINLDLICSNNEDEVNKLLRAIILDGVFYLDLHSRLGEENAVLNAIDSIFNLSQDFFDLDEKEKLLYDVDKLPPSWSNMKLCGYKPVGRNVGGLANNRDGFESYAIPKDGILGCGSTNNFPRPTVVNPYLETLGRFMTFTQAAGQAIFRSLSSVLAVDPSESFEIFHRPGVSSPDILRLLKYQSQPVTEHGSSQVAHTDLGSLTFLFTRQAGLQILQQGASEWAYVAPRTDHAIVNIGDGMSLLSNGLFHSCLHRVTPLQSEAFKTRYSFAYMLRAEDHTPMRGLKSSVIPRGDSVTNILTSGEWLRKKFSMLRKATHESKEDWVLTGVKP